MCPPKFMWLSYLHHASKLQFHFFPRSIALNFVIDLLSWICFFFLYKQSDFTLEKCQDFWRRISWEHHHMQWEINKRSLTGLLRTFLLLCLVIGWKLSCHFLNQLGQKWNQNEPLLSHMPFPAPSPRCDCIFRDLIVHWFICTCDWSK